MFKQVFASGTLNVFPIVGMMIFFVMMLGVYFWVMRPGRSSFYAALSAEALDLDPGQSAGENKSK
jgi:hypothetical protein